MPASSGIPTSRASRAERSLALLARSLGRAPAVDVSWVPVTDRGRGWALAPDMMRLLVALVEELRPHHVLEFGSGASTVLLARAASGIPGCVLSSVEHDPVFAQATADALRGAEGCDRVALQVASLVARGRAGALQPAYLVDRSRLASPGPAEIVLVDGPPAVLGGRAGMLYQALDHAEAGTIVLLDDADRASEREAVDGWAALLGDAVDIVRPAGFERGLCVVVLAAPTKARIRMGLQLAGEAA